MRVKDQHTRSKRQEERLLEREAARVRKEVEEEMHKEAVAEEQAEGVDVVEARRRGMVLSKVRTDSISHWFAFLITPDAARYS